MRAPSSDGVRRFSSRRSLLLIAAGAAIGAVLTGIAVADSGTPPAGGYVTVSPATKVFGGSIGTGKGVSAIAIGGATTVPTNATAVKMSLSVKSTAGGVLVVFPAGDPTAPDSQNVSYAAGTTNVTIVGTVGVKDEVTFHNAGSASATVTVKDVGYSTQLTATNIAPDGGSPGDALVNTGDGAAWSDNGQVLATANFFPGDAGPHIGGIPTFIGSTVPVHMNDENTVAQVTATTDFASTNGAPISSLYSICSAPAATPNVTTAWGSIIPQFTAPAGSFFAQTVTAVVGGLTAGGNYIVGACVSNESSNVTHGAGSGSVILAQSASGVNFFGRRKGATLTVPSNQ
jgi:hypothetical protein